MKKLNILLFCIFLLTLLSLVGCYTKNEINTTSTNNNTNQSQQKISKEESLQILNNYFKDHKVLKNYVDEINKSYELEQIMFHGVNAWKFTINISAHSDFTFDYIIRADTGEFLVKSEPKADGFELDYDSMKRLDDIIEKENKSSK